MNCPGTLQQNLKVAQSLVYPFYPCPFLLVELGLIVFFLGGREENHVVPSLCSDFQQFNASNLQMSLQNPLRILTFFSQFAAIWLIYNSFKGNWGPHLLSIKPHLSLNCRKTIPAVWLLLTRHYVPAERLEVLNFTESILIAFTELWTAATNSLCIMIRVCCTYAGQCYFQLNSW